MAGFRQLDEILGPQYHRPVDHLAIEAGNAAAPGLRLGDGLHNGPGLGKVLLLGHEGRVQGRDLPGVDDALAVKAQLPDQPHLLQEALLVVHVGEHRIQGVDAGGPGGVKDHIPGEKQLRAVPPGGLQVGDIVLRPQGDADEPLGGGGNGIGVEHPLGGLDGRHHARAALRDARFPLDPQDLPLAVDDILGGFGLGQADHMGPGPDDGLQILDAQAALQVVDADHQLLGAVIDAGQGVIHQEPRRILFPEGHGILQVEHDAIAAVDVGVPQHTRIVARHEQHTSAQPLHGFTSQW